MIKNKINLKYKIQIIGCSNSLIKNWNFEKNNISIFPIIANQSTDNGIAGYSSNYITNKKNLTMSGAGSIGNLFIHNEPISGTDHVFCLIPHDEKKYDVSFLLYALKTINWWDLSIGSAQRVLSQNVVKNVLIPNINFHTQTKITNFLDSKTQKLDKITELLKKKQDLLKEYKQSLINETVSGNNPECYVDHRERGQIKMKYILKEIIGGGTPESSNDKFYTNVDTAIPWITIGDMSTVDYVKITEKYLTKQGKESKNLQLLPTGTLIYSIYATIGKVSETLFPATINQALLGFIINEDKISKEYLKFVLKNLEEFIIQKSTSSIQNNLNLESIRNTIIPFYSLNTQNKIFKYIKIKYEIVQKENDYLINQLENIKLYKQSLINETIENGGEQI